MAKKKMHLVPDRVKETCRQKGIKQKDIAQALSIVPQHMSNIVNGRYAVSLDYLRTMSAMLEVDPYFLIGETDDPHGFRILREEINHDISAAAIYQIKEILIAADLGKQDLDGRFYIGHGYSSDCVLINDDELERLHSMIDGVLSVILSNVIQELHSVKKRPYVSIYGAGVPLEDE